MLPVLLAFFACSSDTDSDTGANLVALEPATEVFEMLQGNFDSTAQATDNPTYLEISLKMCAFEMPELGPQVLYVEQAALNDIGNPYRQRIYLVEEVDGRVASHVYAMETSVESAMVGACEDPASISISMDQIVERIGCTVWLEADENGYAGGTEGIECSSSLGGAAYATSEVRLSETKIESWDQGWDRDGNQVWGATSGAYVFDRLN